MAVLLFLILFMHSLCGVLDFVVFKLWNAARDLILLVFTCLVNRSLIPLNAEHSFWLDLHPLTLVLGSVLVCSSITQAPIK